MRVSKLALAGLFALSLVTPASAHYVDAGEYSANKSNLDKKGTKDKRAKGHQESTELSPWDLLNRALTAPAMALTGSVRITIASPFRYVHSNGIPDHTTGQFPNAGNPNTMSEQNYTFRMPLIGAYAAATTPLHMSPFGVAINGVPFDPGANEYWHRDRSSGWQYEAMYMGPRLGLDQNNAHVQPNGAYHYHGIPTGLLDHLRQANRPVLLGYAADGFPIYGPYGYKQATDPNSGLTKLKASYRVKSGNRVNAPGNNGGTSGGNNGYGAADGPGGRYDGAFIQDYEYIASLGDLDDCNGRYGITPDYPKGTYYYVVTDSYPYIPRGYKGTPDESFQRHGPGGGRGPGVGRPGGGPFGGGPPGGGPFGGGPPGGGPGGGPFGGGPFGGSPPGGGSGGTIDSDAPSGGRRDSSSPGQ